MKLSERLLRVAMSGVIPADDQHVIADAVNAHDAMCDALRLALETIEGHFDDECDDCRTAAAFVRVAIAMAEGAE